MKKLLSIILTVLIMSTFSVAFADGIWNDETMKNNPDSYMCRNEVRK